MKKGVPYRAVVGERTFDLELRGTELLVDGAPVDYTFEAVAPAAPGAPVTYVLIVDGESFPAVVQEIGDGQLHVTIGGRRREVRVKDAKSLLLERYGLTDTADAAVREVRAPMPGLVRAVLAEPGAAVRKGDGLVVLEAMKMENELRAAGDGIIQRIHVRPGDAVGKNQLLIELEA